MKPTKAVLEALAKMTAEGRASGVAVNAAALGGGEHRFKDVGGETEAQFQARFIAFAEALGWRCVHTRKVRVQRKNGGVYYETPYQGTHAKGVPDLELVRERLVKVELKVGRNRPTPEQEAWLEAYRAAGVECHVFYPKDWQTITEVLT